MRLVLPWLCDFVRVPGDPESIAHEIGLRGFEVASIEPGRLPVIDFEITANRPDCLSHLGLAREASDSWVGRDFRFLRASGVIRSWTAPKLLDVEKLGYRYDTTAPPQFNDVPQPPDGADIEPFGLDRPDFSPLAAASDVALAAATTLALSGGGGADGRGLVGPGQRWCVRLDGIRSAAPVAVTYTVALGSGEVSLRLR